MNAIHRLVRERLPAEVYRIGAVDDLQLAIDLLEHTEQLFTGEQLHQAEREAGEQARDVGYNDGYERAWSDVDRVLMEPLTDEQKLARIKLLSGLPR